MSDSKDRIEVLLKQTIEQAETYNETKVAPDRIRSYDYYYGSKPTAIRGQPPFVHRVVFQKIQEVLPHIKDPFVSGQDVARFIPAEYHNPKDCFDAEIATQAVNRILKIDNDVDSLLNDVILDGLICNTGVAKAYWQESYIDDKHVFEGLSRMAVDMLEQEDDVIEIIVEPIIPEFNINIIAPMIGEAITLVQDATSWEEVVAIIPEAQPFIEEMLLQMVTYNGEATRRIDTSSVRVDAIAPENFLIDEDATCMSDAIFCAQKHILTPNQLVDMDFDDDLTDEAINSGSGGAFQADILRQARNQTDATDFYQNDQDYLVLYECYIRTALVDHGYDDCKNKPAKLYQVYICNSVILEMREVDEVPFFKWNPFIIPHKFYGQGLAEELTTHQDVLTFYARASAQYLAFSTNPRYKATGQAEYDLASFQANLPGSVVPIKQGDLIPFQMPQMDGSIFQSMSIFQQNVDEVSGVSSMMAGMDPNVLRSNVAGSTVTAAMSAGQHRIKNFTRNLANQLVKPLYAYVYELYRVNSKTPFTAYINGQPQSIHPSNLPRRGKVAIDVLMGRNDRVERATILNEARLQMANDPQMAQIYTPQVAYNMTVDILKNFGITDPGSLITAPQDAQRQPTPAEREQAAMKQREQEIMMAAEQNRQLALQLEQEKLNIRKMEIELEYQFKARELEFKQQKAADEQILEEKEVELEALKATADIKLKEMSK